MAIAICSADSVRRPDPRPFLTPPTCRLRRDMTARTRVSVSAQV